MDKHLEISQSGFTLIELMIVLAIIGILVAIAIPKFEDMLVKTRRTDGYMILQAIHKIQVSHFADNDKFINQNADRWVTLSDMGLKEHFLSDPLGPITQFDYYIFFDEDGDDDLDYVTYLQCDFDPGDSNWDILAIQAGSTPSTPVFWIGDPVGVPYIKMDDLLNKTYGS